MLDIPVYNIYILLHNDPNIVDRVNLSPKHRMNGDETTIEKSPYFDSSSSGLLTLSFVSFTPYAAVVTSALGGFYSIYGI